MKCKCKAKPRPIITWYRGTTVVKESSKIKMTTVDLGEDTYEIIMEIQVRIRLVPPYELILLLPDQLVVS